MLAAFSRSARCWPPIRTTFGHISETQRGATTDRSFPSEPRCAVATVILRKVQEEKEVLLVRRAKAPGKGQYAFPGGSQELGGMLQ